jgi:hypothetical protein
MPHFYSTKTQALVSGKKKYTQILIIPLVSGYIFFLPETSAISIWVYFFLPETSACAQKPQNAFFNQGT